VAHSIVEEFFFERIAILIHDGELAEKEAIDKAYLMTWKMFPNKPMPDSVLAVVKGFNGLQAHRKPAD